MRINNRKRAVVFKRIFFLVSVFLAVAALVFFLFDKIVLALISIGVFSLWYLYFHVADYQFVEFSDDKDRILLRYFKSISFGKPHYNEIEFPQYVLKKAHFENSIFGENSDLTLIVKTKKGIAEYPSVSLSALDKTDRNKMKASLNEILSNYR